MKLGGLFSGIGGFELAWQRQGGAVAWMCEIDPSARKVLEHRFPGVPIYPDVSELDPDEVEAVDVVTGGSPCQGFSIAGARTGLEHVESRLFADYVRIIDGLADRGLSYAIWENVPGVLSISNDDGERTFPHVVAALVGADQPVRLDGNDRWNTGLAVRDGRAVAWRVVDSRHFGVPQRRRRVYACVAFGGAAGDRAGRALLAKPEGVRGDFAACGQAGQESAGTARAGAAESFNWQQGDSELGLADDAHTLGTTSAPAVLLTMREGKDGGGKGPLLSEDESLTLATGNSQVLFAPQGIAENQRGEVVATDYSHAVTSGGGKPGQGYPAVFAWQAGGDHTSSGAFNDDGTTPTLPRNQTLATTGAYGVRRLTPVEAERLQGFPDGWTDPAGSDSARYRALGNAVTVNVPEWLFGRMTW